MRCSHRQLMWTLLIVFHLTHLNALCYPLQTPCFARSPVALMHQCC